MLDNLINLRQLIDALLRLSFSFSVFANPYEDAIGFCIFQLTNSVS